MLWRFAATAFACALETDASQLQVEMAAQPEEHILWFGVVEYVIPWILCIRVVEADVVKVQLRQILGGMEILAAKEDKTAMDPVPVEDLEVLAQPQEIRMAGRTADSTHVDRTQVGQHCCQHLLQESKGFRQTEQPAFFHQLVTTRDAS